MCYVVLLSWSFCLNSHKIQPSSRKCLFSSPGCDRCKIVNPSALKGSLDQSKNGNYIECFSPQSFCLRECVVRLDAWHDLFINPLLSPCTEVHPVLKQSTHTPFILSLPFFLSFSLSVTIVAASNFSPVSLHFRGGKIFIDFFFPFADNSDKFKTEEEESLATTNCKLLLYNASRYS